MKVAVTGGVILFAILVAAFIWIALHPPGPREQMPAALPADCSAEPCANPSPAAVPLSTPDQSVDYGARVLDGGTTVRKMYERTCAACHIAGLAGAPRVGNREEWQPRVEKGMEALYHSALVGMPPGMPAKGLCFDCTTDDLKKMVDFLVASSR